MGLAVKPRSLTQPEAPDLGPIGPHGPWAIWGLPACDWLPSELSSLSLSPATCLPAWDSLFLMATGHSGNGGAVLLELSQPRATCAH